MLILIILGVVCLASSSFARSVGWAADSYGPAFLLGGISGCFLVIGIVAVPLNSMNVRGGIESLEATRETYAAARDAGASLELAAVQSDVAEMNRWLAAQKYYNSTALGLWIPDAVEDVEPIQ